MMKLGIQLHPSLVALLLAGCSGETAQPKPTGSVSAEVSAQANDDALAEATPSTGASSETLASTVRSYPPSDACAKLPGWLAFRNSLHAAVAKRDAEALSALSAPDIRLDFGGGEGVEELRKQLADQTLDLWQELEKVLLLGCKAEGGFAAMPSIFWEAPGTDDSYTLMLSLGQNVPAFPDAGGRGKPLATLNWQLVNLDESEVFLGTEKFAKVRLPDRKTKAWIETAKLRSLLDYRLIAEPQDGTWRITAFIAGD